MKILFVVPYPPTPLRRRPFELLSRLGEAGHSVTLATIGPVAPSGRAAGPRVDSAGMAVDAGPGNGADQVIRVPISRPRRALSMLAAAARGEPLQARFDWSPSLARRLERELATGDYDVVHVEHLRGALYGRSLVDRAPVVWDSVDCISALFAAAACHAVSRRHRVAARLELERTRRLEARLPELFDRTVVTADADRDALVALRNPACSGRSSTPRVSVIPNGVDTDGFAPPPGVLRDAETIVFTGKLSYHANIAAAAFLIREVMPRVWRVRPGARALLAGADPAPEIRRLAARDTRLELTGTVDDLRPFLARATVAVVPLVYGVGIQNKALEAMACGTPVVATPAAARALAAQDGRELLIGRDAAGLAAGILDLLDSPARAAAIGAAGRRYVQRRHAWSDAARAFEEVYRLAVEHRRRVGR